MRRSALSVGLAGIISLLVPLGVHAQTAPWRSQHRDPQHTGRASFSVPASRLNSGLFNIGAWQKPSPGSPTIGSLGASSMVFYDNVGPGGADVVVSGYHWPKGVQGMDRHTGKLLWNGLPDGGESIGECTPAFSVSGQTMYVVNDATAVNAQWPEGRPLMAFATAGGPGSFWHSGASPQASLLSFRSPVVASDGRIFLHSWNNRPAAAVDSGSALTLSWVADQSSDQCFTEAAIDEGVSPVRVVTTGRAGWVRSHDGGSGASLWSVHIGEGTDANPTINPANGNIYVNAGSSSIVVAGINRLGGNLWSTTTKTVYSYSPGVNNPQRAHSTGCLSHDGGTYYFQTASQQADGRLYAINTGNGSVRWSVMTGNSAWEGHCSSPIVTPNGVIFVGTNNGDTYLAIKDNGVSGTIVATKSVDAGGIASATPTLSDDGLLYLPMRTAWTVSNGDGQIPSGEVENLYTGINLNAGATQTLPPPSQQRARALNASVELKWKPITDPTGSFANYAVYRDTQPFTSIQGKTPLTLVSGIATSMFLDTTATNGVGYHYAVAAVSQGGGQVTTIASVGPRTPRNETDLQVIAIERTPRFERYAPEYTYQSIIEPGGFGPYGFSAATSLGQGQTGATQRWPNLGQAITYTATVRNRGTNAIAGSVSGRWKVDGVIVATQPKSVNLTSGATTTYSYQTTWDNALHDITFEILYSDARPANNAVTRGSKGAPFLTYADVSYIENFRENTPVSYPGAETDDLFDWLNTHMVRFNQMFEDAGSEKRVHYELLASLDDFAPDPNVNTIEFAIFPFRYHHTDGDARLSGYYNPGDDIDYGLLHEMGHQLGLIDLYQLDTPGSINQVSGLSYSAVDCLMRTVAPFLSDHSSLAMDHWLHVAHGYYGQYLYSLPDNITMRFIGQDGQPLVGAVVKVYQRIERPGVGNIIPNEIKFQGVTNGAGEYTLPNVPINPALIPTTFAGDSLKANPFGYVAVVGNNGLLHFKVEHAGSTDYAWLEITEANVAFWQGQTGNATFERELSLGGAVQRTPPSDMTEENAGSWEAWAEGASASVFDDSSMKVVGDASLRFETDGGFDTLARYPGDQGALWDCSNVTSIRFWARAQNPNIGFQEGSPWVRLFSANGWVEWRSASTLLNQANGQWKQFEIPIAGSAEWIKSTQGSPDLGAVNAIEIHADTWGAGFTLWLDGVGFDPPVCYPDCDFSGSLDFFDFLCFQNAFATGQPYGDCDLSGQHDFFDFLCFQNAFAFACP